MYHVDRVGKKVNSMVLGMDFLDRCSLRYTGPERRGELTLHPDVS